MQQQQMVDPFAQMDAMMGQMMMSPFGGMGGRGSRGMGMGGGIFGELDGMMEQMMGGGMMGPMGPGGMHGQMMSMSSGSGGQGGFSCQTMMMSSSMGADGQRHTEHFSSSTVGDRGRNVAEIQQAYSNSGTGVDKMSMERQMNDRGRKMVKEYNRQTGEERNTDLFRGMTENESGAFDSQWQQTAQPYVPPHADMRQLTLQNAAGASRAPAAIQGQTRAGRSGDPGFYGGDAETVVGGYPSQYTASQPVPSSLYSTSRPSASYPSRGAPYQTGYR
jgi:hypothetical protein